tara:strand:+ start:3127 stop:4134 length:1008 start_codon:yes stop_codon:yes gene_type:complete
MISILNYIALCFVIFYCFTLLSYKFNYIDIPDQRKIHSKPTAYTGGISTSIILLFALLYFEIFDVLDRKINLIISIGFLTSIVGLIDDRYNLNVGTKLSLQIVPVFYLIAFENIVLSEIGNYIFFVLELGVFKIPFTVICVLFLTNAFNYFDGLDGTLSFSCMSVLAILYFLLFDYNFKYLFILLIIPLSIFLFFNFRIFNLPKLFLGDSGSLFYGFLISFLLIHIASLNIIHPILLAWSIVIFVYEFLSINIIRIKNKIDPFRAGKDHLHHVLLKKFKSKLTVNLIIVTLNFLLFIIGYLSFYLLNALASFILYLIFFIFFLIIRDISARKLSI